MLTSSQGAGTRTALSWLHTIAGSGDASDQVHVSLHTAHASMMVWLGCQQVAVLPETDSNRQQPIGPQRGGGHGRDSECAGLQQPVAIAGGCLVQPRGGQRAPVGRSLIRPPTGQAR